MCDELIHACIHTLIGLLTRDPPACPKTAGAGSRSTGACSHSRLSTSQARACRPCMRCARLSALACLRRARAGCVACGLHTRVRTAARTTARTHAEWVMALPSNKYDMDHGKHPGRQYIKPYYMQARVRAHVRMCCLASHEWRHDGDDVHEQAMCAASPSAHIYAPPPLRARAAIRGALRVCDPCCRRRVHGRIGTRQVLLRLSGLCREG